MADCKRLTPAIQVSILIIVAVAVRVIVVLSLSRLPWFTAPNVDSAVYDRLAKAFASGDVLLGTDPLRMSPAYPFLLGLVYRVFGEGLWAIRVVQGLLGVCLVVLTWDTARRLMGTLAAMAAGGAVALFGPALFYEAQLLSDAPAATSAGLALWLMIRTMVRGEARASRWIVVGVATGAVALFRPNGVLLAVPLAAAAVWANDSSGRARRLRIGAAALGFVIGLSPVPIRNALTTGHATLTSAHGGINFYVGNGPGATGMYRTPTDLGTPAAQVTGPEEQFAMFQNAAERSVGHPLDPSAADRYWFERTLEWIKVDPESWGSLMFRKFRLFWNGASISDIEHYEFTRTLDPVLAWPFVQWWTFMPFALFGTFLALWKRGPAAVVALFNLAWCAGLVIIFVADRYRLPALPGLAITAALAVQQGPAIWENGARWTRAALAATLVGTAVMVWPADIGTRLDALWFRLGVGYQRAGRVEEARNAYLHAVQIEPGNAPARQALERLGGSPPR